MPDYIPTTDLGKRAWALVFKNGITPAPTSLGLTSGQATAFGTAYTTYDTCLDLTLDPATRTTSTILDKDVARDAMVAMARDLAGIIQTHPGVTPGQLNDLGLTIRDEFPTPIGAPTTKPIVNVERIMNLGHVLRIRDEATPTSNAKAPGVIGYEVFYKVSETEPLSVAECTYSGLATRVPHTVNFGPADKNKTVWYIVRPINGKGEWGPISDQISASIAA